MYGILVTEPEFHGSALRLERINNSTEIFF